MTDTQLLGVAAESLRSQAHELSTHGRRVFPVTVDGIPLIKKYHGSNVLSSAHLDLLAWRSAADLGVALRPNEVLLDVDSKDGRKQGWDHLRWLEEILGPLPSAPRQLTRTGGAHLLFRLPAGLDEGSLGSKVVLPNGRYSHIDIVRHTNRYARIYDPGLWIGLKSEDLPALPDQWVEALLKISTSSLRSQASSGVTGLSLDESIEVISSTLEGARNETLSQESYRRFVEGDTDAASIQALRDAGLASGLPEWEVDAVLNSAWTGAWRRFSPFDQWLLVVEKMAREFKPRSAHRIMALAVLLTEKSLMLQPGTYVSLSTRDAAEHVGVAEGTVRKDLQWFTDLRLLERQSVKTLGLAHEYRVFSKGRTYSQQQEQVRPFENPFGLRMWKQRQLTDLHAAPAFQRVGGKAAHLPALPRSSIRILKALEMGPSSIREISEKSQVAVSTVYRAVPILESAGLLVRDGRVVSPNFEGDCESAISEWSSLMGLEAKVEVRANRHNHQRFEFGEFVLWKQGVRVAGHPRGRLRKMSKGEDVSRVVRTDAVVVIERRRGRPVIARLEAAT